MIRKIDLYDDGLKQAILNLPFNTQIDANGVNCDMIYIPERDYGFAEIYRMYDDILVFIIPEYGGTPSFVYHTDRTSIDSLINNLKNN